MKEHRREGSILKIIGVLVAAASMVAMIGVAPANAKNAGIFYTCGACWTRVESAVRSYDLGTNSLGIMNAADKKRTVYARNGYLLNFKKYANVNLDFSKYRNIFSLYEGKPAFSLPGNFSPAVGAVVAATRGHIVDSLIDVNVTENFNSKKVISINNNKEVFFIDEHNVANHKYNNIPKVNVSGDDSSVSTQVAGIVWPNNQGAKHVYYVMPNNVDAVSAGMFSDGPVIVLGQDGAKPQGAFNNLPAVCVGGPACSAPGMENAEKIVGKDRYETNYLVNKKIFAGNPDKSLRYDFSVQSTSLFLDFLMKGKETFKSRRIIFASGTDGHIVDSAVAGISSLPVIIVDENGNNSYTDKFKQLIPGPVTAYGVGGDAVITANAAKNIIAKVTNW